MVQEDRRHGICSLFTDMSMDVSKEMLSFVSCLSSDPLFSMFITSYTLLLLYFPACFLNLMLSPTMVISNALLLGIVLHLGSNQALKGPESLASPAASFDAYGQKPLFTESMVRAPLQVIYEEHEGEDMLLPYYQETETDTDTDSSSDWESPENMCLCWEAEDDKGGLIEISLDDGKRCWESQVEEENFIEIDLGAPPIGI